MFSAQSFSIIRSLLLAAFCCFFPLSKSIGQDRGCITWDRHQKAMLQDAQYRLRYEAYEQKASGNVSSGMDTGIVIPVVVHVVYHLPAENISDEQIQSQIDVLNEDYAALNAGILDVPAAWSSLITDSKIRFKLASRDPNGQYTTGVTRTYTSQLSFSLGNNDLFFTSLGGQDAWPNSKYLNIWVCNLADNALGYASFPGSGNATDGVVIAGRAFGRLGAVKSPYDHGRTTTHEIGHWLTLLHIWGDDNGDCNGSDQVNDTPNQANSHFRCPSFPNLDACSPNSPGAMYMNYLDYTDDKCMQFFTPGQLARMWNALDNPRRDLKVSNGLVNPAPKAFDLSIDSVLDPVRSSNARCFQPVLRLKNEGLDTIRFFQVKYNIYNSLSIPKVHTWMGLLLPGATLLDTLPAISADFGNQVIEFRLQQSDSNLVNNYKSCSFKMNSSVDANCSNEGILVYPNPVYGQSTTCVKVAIDQSQLSQVRLFNAAGQLLSTFELQINPGDAFALPLESLAAGLYYLQITGDLYTKSTRLIYLPGESTIQGPSICDDYEY